MCYDTDGLKLKRLADSCSFYIKISQVICTAIHLADTVGNMVLDLLRAVREEW